MPETKVKERPILFSAPMVRALLEGHKTQTRRIVKPQPTDDMLNGVILSTDGDWYPWLEHTAVPCNDERWRCPYGQVGDRLWVKETYRLHFINGSEERGWDIGLEYRADDDGTGVFPPRTVHIDEKPKGGWPTLCKAGHNPWRSPRFMPRWASRILLEVTDIRVERVRDISEEDSMAEGIQHPPNTLLYSAGGDFFANARDCFLDLFYDINKRAPRGENPWVWAITFKVLEKSEETMVALMEPPATRVWACDYLRWVLQAGRWYCRANMYGAKMFGPKILGWAEYTRDGDFPAELAYACFVELHGEERAEVLMELASSSIADRRGER